MAREPLIGSSTRGFRLGSRRVSLGGYGNDVTLDSFIPLPTQLAFKRGDITGQSYKAIVDRALKTAPGHLQRQLLIEQSEAMEKAESEGRKIRRLQAEVKAASIPGRTAKEAAILHNFWVDEASRAAKEGDGEYYLQALKNAANARELVDKRRDSEGSAATSNLRRLYNEEDTKFNQFYRQIEDSYQSGLKTGQEADKQLAELLRIRALDLKTRLSELAEMQNQGITKVGRTEVQSLVENASRELYGGIQSDGTTSNGIIDTYRKIASRANNPENYVDIVRVNPEGGYEIERRLTPVNSENEVYIKDNFGRYVQVEKGETPDGKVYLFADVPQEDGSIRRIQTQAVESLGGETIQELLTGKAGLTFSDPLQPDVTLDDFATTNPDLAANFKLPEPEAPEEQGNDIGKYLEEIKNFVPQTLGSLIDRAANNLAGVGPDKTAGDFQLTKDAQGKTITLPPPAAKIPGTPALPRAISPTRLRQETAIKGPIKLPAKINLTPGPTAKPQGKISPNVLSNLKLDPSFIGPQPNPTQPKQQSSNLLKSIFNFFSPWDI